VPSQLSSAATKSAQRAKPKRCGHYIEYQYGCTPVATIVKCYWGMRQALAIT
jgi:hypothetical protein